MSIYKDGKLIAGGRQCMPLLSFMWADHILNDASWLRADTFSWQSGAVYQAAYQHLANDITGKTLQSETISGTTIQFYLADDGHKICPASQESNVTAIYNATGVAWYYIIDTTNQRFKLPRTKFGITGLRDSVGKYVPQEVILPDITGNVNGVSNRNFYSSPTADGAFYVDSYSNNNFSGGGGIGSNSALLHFKASRSSSVYSGDGTNTLIHPRATQMYLYFYVGNFTQTALENTAGVVTEDFNELNAHKVVEFQAPTTANNYTWYRKYADGWVEQGGITEGGQATPVTVNLPVTMASGKYQIQLTPQITDNTDYTYTLSRIATIRNSNNYTNNTTSFMYAVTSTTGASTVSVVWEVKGVAA